MTNNAPQEMMARRVSAARLSRMELARRAYIRACDELDYAIAAGTLHPLAALRKLDRLNAAYAARKEALRFSSFVASHWLQKVFARNWSNAMKISQKEQGSTLANRPQEHKDFAA